MSNLLRRQTEQISSNAGFPAVRMRRLRRSAGLRGLVRETTLSVSDFVYPLFVTHGRDIKRPIEPMPGQFQLSLDRLLAEVAEAQALKIPAVLLFGIPSHKDAIGSEAYDSQGVIQEAVTTVKQAAPDLIVMTDVCLCEYTDHGHCGLLTDDGVDNDATLELLAKIAVSHADAGADVVAPSAMMDGQVAAIRRALDAARHDDVGVMSYASKMASAYYGPFRVAAGSTPRQGDDRRAYQMDGANGREAMREMEQDAAEGADILMVKPALAYLDILSRARTSFDHPLAAYNVSGEYAMLKAAAVNGWVDEQAAILETLTSIKRAGADLIITYFAKDAAKALRVSG